MYGTIGMLVFHDAKKAETIFLCFPGIEDNDLVFFPVIVAFKIRQKGVCAQVRVNLTKAVEVYK